MQINLKLDYIGDGIFDLSRWEGRKFIAERSGIMGKSNDGVGHVRSWMYHDNVAVDTEFIPASDGYSHLLVTVMYSGVEDECDTVALNCVLGCPVIITFRYFDELVETMSKEGGITEEFHGKEQADLVWRDGVYVR